eukprot:gene10369-10702_t
MHHESKVPNAERLRTRKEVCVGPFEPAAVCECFYGLREASHSPVILSILLTLATWLPACRRAFYPWELSQCFGGLRRMCDSRGIEAVLLALPPVLRDCIVSHAPLPAQCVAECMIGFVQLRDTPPASTLLAALVPALLVSDGTLELESLRGCIFGLRGHAGVVRRGLVAALRQRGGRLLE